MSKIAKEQQQQNATHKRNNCSQQGKGERSEKELLFVARESLLVAHDVLPNYYNYVGKTKILINDNFFVVSASQLIKSITHNGTEKERVREGEGGSSGGSQRVCEEPKCCQVNFVIKVYNAMRRMASRPSVSFPVTAAA